MSIQTSVALYSICVRCVRQSSLLVNRCKQQVACLTTSRAPLLSSDNSSSSFSTSSIEKVKPAVPKYSSKGLPGYPRRPLHTSVRCHKLEASPVSEADYESYAEETLDSLTEFFEDLPETEQCNEEYDCAYGSGVLTIHLGSAEGTFVINKQTPNKQIWLSSPLSGPKRYDYYDGQWIYLRDGSSLHTLLESEISSILNIKIKLGKCKFYGKGVAFKEQT